MHLLQIIWFTLFCLWVASEFSLMVATRTRVSQGKVQDRGSQLLLVAAIIVACSTCDWTRSLIPAATWPRTTTLSITAIALLALGLAIRWTAIRSLGRAFSVNVAIRPDQQIHRTGLYRVVRHPSYSGLMLVLAAVGLHSRNWVGLALVLVPTTAALLYRIRVEEQALQNAFGPAYADYARVTRRLIPGLY